MKVEMSSGPADLEGSRFFIALRMSDSDIGGTCSRSLLSGSYSKERFDRPIDSALQTLWLLHGGRRCKHH